MEIYNARVELQECVQAVAAKNAIARYKIESVETNAKGEGYIGEIFMVSLKDEDSPRRMDIILKAAFKNEKIRDLIPIRLSYENEIYFYDTVMPAYREFQEERGIPHPPTLTAECYHFSLTDSMELIAFENLKTLGFETVDQKGPLNDAHIRMVFDAYGKFHAYSCALRDQRPELYARIVGDLHDVYGELTKSEFFRKHIDLLFTSIGEYLVAGEDDEVIGRFQKYLNYQVMDRFDEGNDPNCKYPVIRHGDCWSNNMLFKYKNSEEGVKTPVDMRLIDFQLMQEGSPVCDLSYCFYSGAWNDEIDRLEEYLEVYYASFSAFLTQLGSDPKKLYPFEGLKEDWRKHSRFGYIFGFNILRLKLTDAEDKPDMNALDLDKKPDLKESSERFKNTKLDEETYKKRIRYMLKHLAAIDAL